MKTIEELIKEVKNSAALQDKLIAVKEKDELAEFIKENDCEADVEAFVRALMAEVDAEGEISDDSAEAAAGGIQAGDLTKKIRTEFSPFIEKKIKVPDELLRPKRKYPYVL